MNRTTIQLNVGILKYYRIKNMYTYILPICTSMFHGLMLKPRRKYFFLLSNIGK